MRIDQLLVIAGATASGKSTLIREMLAGRLPELRERLAAGDLNQWVRRDAYSREIVVNAHRMIVEYDFLWHGLDVKEIREDRGKLLLDSARELLLITLWAQPARLEEQFLRGRLAAPVPANRGGKLRGGLFRLLPRLVIRRLSRLPLLDRLNRWLPGTALLRGLLAVRIYSSPGRAA